MQIAWLLVLGIAGIFLFLSAFIAPQLYPNLFGPFSTWLNAKPIRKHAFGIGGLLLVAAASIILAMGPNPPFGTASTEDTLASHPSPNPPLFSSSLTPHYRVTPTTTAVTKTPSNTPSPLPTNIPSPTSSPSPSPEPSTTPSPTFTSRPIPTPESFLQLLREHEDVEQRLGSEKMLVAQWEDLGAYQELESGVMIYRSHVPRDVGIYVLVVTEIVDGNRRGTWQTYPDRWQVGREEVSEELFPPGDLFQPTFGFGLIWYENEEVRTGLGWGTMCEMSVDLVVQTFTDGMLIRIERWNHWSPYYEAAMNSKCGDAYSYLGKSFALFYAPGDSSKGTWQELGN